MKARFVLAFAALVVIAVGHIACASGTNLQPSSATGDTDTASQRAITRCLCQNTGFNPQSSNGKEGLDFWHSLKRQSLEREGVKSLEEKKLKGSNAAIACIGGSELKDAIVRDGIPGFDTNIVSLDCQSTDGFGVLFVGEPSDLQPFYSFVLQIRRKK